ncbi:MAG: type II secretion system F family protein, partial [Gammaproteobacteria bacterium]|nr:type II secretion system F family protein [Gammaproteobacteria bacterium]
MREFTYLARSRDGKNQQGTVKAESRDEVLAILRHQGLLVLDVQAPRRWAEILANVNIDPMEYRPMHSIDVEQNFHQLAVMLRAGLPLVEGVEIVGENSRRAVRKVWEQIKQRIQGGSSLSEAMRAHKVFSNFVVQLIKVGEQTGYLDRSLEQGSAELE